jgi:hypothetical protein
MALFGKDAARTIMTMRRLIAAGLVLSGLSVLSWSRADGDSRCPCDPIIAVNPDDCGGGTHDEAMQRYRSNQSRHWRSMVLSTR